MITFAENLVVWHVVKLSINVSSCPLSCVGGNQIYIFVGIKIGGKEVIFNHNYFS